VSGPGVPTRNSIGTKKSFRGHASVTRRRLQSERDMVVDSESVPQRVWMHHGRPVRTRPSVRGPRAILRRRAVRSDDADRRDAELEQSDRRSAGAPPAEREHPCPARGAFATRDSRRGTVGGNGATSTRSTRSGGPGTRAGWSRSPVQRTGSAKETESRSAPPRCPAPAPHRGAPIRRSCPDPE
jgi:hypothetical protein